MTYDMDHGYMDFPHRCRFRIAVSDRLKSDIRACFPDVRFEEGNPYIDIFCKNKDDFVLIKLKYEIYEIYR